jgi:dTDP-glucose pyrophosphorylase
MKEYVGEQTMKGLIPAAGTGDRMKPITLAIPKELLMVGQKACIEHVVDAYKHAGITDITIIVGWKKHAILDYFGSGKRLDVHITYLVQDERQGLAKAVEVGKKTMGTEPFAVVLGDNFFYPKTFLGEIIKFHQQKHSDCTVGVFRVDDVSPYGAISPDEKTNRILDIIEKPPSEKAPSNLACAGIYVFEPSIFDAISQTQPDKNDEYQLTDAIKLLIENHKNVYYKKLKGRHIDIGSPKRLKEANDFFTYNVTE